MDFLAPSLIVLLVFGLPGMFETVAGKTKKYGVRQLDS